MVPARSVVVLTDGYSNTGLPVKHDAQALAHITKANEIPESTHHQSRSVVKCFICYHA
jgi:hypothetical protein